MTNDLSKQLCELCGIKPKCECTGTSLNRDRCTEFGRYVPLETYYCSKECEFRGDYKYPDFTKPENLVKLFELKPSETMEDLYSEITNLTHTCYMGPWTNLSEYFLKRLLVVIDSDIFISKIDQEKIKTAMRNTEWNYG